MKILILFSFLALIVNTKALICNYCANCFNNPVTYQTCAAGYNYCYTSQYGNNINSGCASTCIPGTNTQCCSGNYCNAIIKQLQCNTCVNCYINAPFSQFCASNQNYCYYTQNGNNINAGCAQTCASGTNTKCCNTNNCNPVQRQLTCNACSNCYYNRPVTQTCRSDQNYCYVSNNNNGFVEAGCASSCIPGTNTRCCDTGNCNSIPAASTLQCYECKDCKYNIFNLQKCAPDQFYCFKELSNGGNYVTRGCAKTCSQGTNVKCCTTYGCNHSNSLMKFSFDKLIIITGLLFLKFLFYEYQIPSFRFFN